MSVEQQIRHLVKRLAFLGYNPLQVELIIETTIGHTAVETVGTAEKSQVIQALEKYAQLGQEFQLSFSK